MTFPENLERATLGKILVGLILTSLGIHLFSLYFSQSFISNTPLVDVPLHSSLEMAGGMIAFVVAFLLLALEEREVATSFNLRLATALIGMGVFDVAHAMVPVGQTFVWLHTLATFSGGLLFATIWLPDRVFRQMGKTWPVAVGAVSVTVAVLSLQFPSWIPEMVDSEEFSQTARILNLTGGTLFLVASARLIVSFREAARTDDLLFSVHCLLFGAAGILFESSQLWNVTWWGWHILRLMAYGAALVFAVDSTLRDQEELRDYRDSLEQKVDRRTRELEEAVEEREILLEETHHRVKNNMQIISSMLSLQENRVEQEQLRKKFDDALSRIDSMALVHELLYQSEDFARLNFEAYTDQLVKELKQSHVSKDQEVSVRTRVESVELNLDTAIRCGLILNELLTNAFQHAFPDDRGGTIEVSFQRTDQGNRLKISDDGAGFDLEDVADREDSIGLKLVRTLVRFDLDGTIDTKSEDGTTITVDFPTEKTET